MSTEVYTPEPLNPDTAAEHQVVRGESASASSGDIDHLDGMLNDQSSGQTPEKKRRKEIVDGISPANVHLYGEATLDKVLIARSLLHDEDFSSFSPEERDEVIEALLDQIVAVDDEKNAEYLKGTAYPKHRLELKDVLMQPAEKFQKTQRRFEGYQAVRDKVKIAKQSSDDEGSPSEPFTKRLKALFERESDESGETSKPASTEAKLNKKIKRLDRRNDGLVGKVAETGTKVSFLESQLGEFHDRMDAHGANVNDKTRRSVERETIRSLVRAKDLADAKGLEGDERKAYMDGLVDTFHDYATLSDEDRDDFHEALSARYSASKERDNLQNEAEAAPEKKDSRVTRFKRSLGALAARTLDVSTKRWEARKASTDESTADTEVDAAGDDAEFGSGKRRINGEKLKDIARTAGDLPLVGYHNMRAYFVTRAESRREKLATMSSEEREQQRDHKVLIGMGVAGVALFAASVYYMKYGLDNPFNGIGNTADKAPTTSGQGGGLSDLLHVPDPSGAEAQDILPGTDISRQGGGNNLLNHSELFTGSRSSRSLTPENAQHLNEFMSDYKVKNGDNQGVWGISEKYLKTQGIKNPTVFETDAVKDYILQHSSLTNSSIIHPGDTIRLK